MEVLKKNINSIGIAILAILFILYNLNPDDDIIYCGTITDIESYSLKSVKTDFLIIKLNNGKTIEIPGNEYYQTVGKPVEVIEKTSLFGNKTYKVNNTSTNSDGTQLKHTCK